MPLELFIAWRYLKARRKGVFTLLTTIIAVGGITLGVGALIITLAVMSGFHIDIKEKILGLQPHLVVLRQDRLPIYEHEYISNEIHKNKSIVNTSPFILSQAIIKNKQISYGAVIKGIDWSRETKLTNLKKNIVSQDKELNNLKDGQIIIGKELANNLGLQKGEDAIIMGPGSLGFVPKMQKFKVVGTFHSGMYEYDANLAYISLGSGQKLFGLKDSVTGIGASVSNWEKSNLIEKVLQHMLSYPYYVRSWQKLNRNLFAALKLEKIMMFIILTLIILVAAFNIISNLLLLTIEKSKDIGILSAIGLDKNEIGRIFLYEGLIIGFSGIFFGSFLGIALSLLLKKYEFIHLPAGVYYLDTLPVRIVPSDVLLVIAATVVITLIAVLYPAYQATKLDPIETIRYG